MGFIRNLPHTLVTSFRATLEEVEQAEVLLHVRDACFDLWRGAEERRWRRCWVSLRLSGKPRIEVLNKIDLLDAHEREGLAAREQPRDQRQVKLLVSAQSGEGMDALLAAIDKALFSDPIIETELRVPQSDGAAAGRDRRRHGGAFARVRGQPGASCRERTGIAGGPAAKVPVAR